MNIQDLIATTTIAKTTSVGNVRTIEDLEGMTMEELLDLRDEIDKHLPATKLSDINLTEEVVLQYQKVKSMQTRVLDSNTSAQQKAAVANACASALSHLVKMQTELHNAERFKIIEGLMIKYMKKLPIDVATAFIDEYERLET